MICVNYKQRFNFDISNLISFTKKFNNVSYNRPILYKNEIVWFSHYYNCYVTNVISNFYIKYIYTRNTVVLIIMVCSDYNDTGTIIYIFLNYSHIYIYINKLSFINIETCILTLEFIKIRYRFDTCPTWIGINS